MQFTTSYSGKLWEIPYIYSYVTEILCRSAQWITFVVCQSRMDKRVMLQ
jgi:hypothetical protein